MDWWIIIRNWATYNNAFYFYLLNSAGVTLDHIQNIGDSVSSSVYRIEPSKSGEKVACITNKGLISIFSFGRCAGLFSNELNIEHENPDGTLIPWYWDCELSPNEQILYVSEQYTSFDT